MSDDLYARGMEVRRAMFGPAGAETAVANASELAKPFHDIMTRQCFGEIWNRPNLGRRDRSLITLAMLIAMGKENEVRIHVIGALANGVTRDEIQEVILHSMTYCGVPAAVGALRAAEQVLEGSGDTKW
jgi:4-carboxymuconolactone decarboxylase